MRHDAFHFAFWRTRVRPGARPPQSCPPARAGARKRQLIPMLPSSAFPPPVADIVPTAPMQLSDEDAQLSVEAFLHKTCDGLVRDVLASAESASNRLRASFRAEKASILSAYDAAAAASKPSAASSSRAGAGAAPPGSLSATGPGASASADAAPGGAAGPAGGAATEAKAAAPAKTTRWNVRAKVMSGPHAGIDTVLRPRQRRLVPKFGRSTGQQFVKNGISLPEDDEVSTTHAKLEARGGAVWVTDLDSTNGSILDGASMPPGEPLPLPHQCILRVGQSDIHLTMEPAE